MQELIVILACFSGKGCTETSSAYYNANPSLREWIAYSEERAKDFAGPFVVEYVAPTIAMTSGEDIYVKVSREYSVKLQQDTVSVRMVKEW